MSKNMADGRGRDRREAGQDGSRDRADRRGGDAGGATMQQKRSELDTPQMRDFSAMQTPKQYDGQQRAPADMRKTGQTGGKKAKKQGPATISEERGDYG